MTTPEVITVTILTTSQMHLSFGPYSSLRGALARVPMTYEVFHPGAVYTSKRLKTTPMSNLVFLLFGLLPPASLLPTRRSPGCWPGADRRNVSPGCCHEGLGCSYRRTRRQMDTGKHTWSVPGRADRQAVQVFAISSFSR